MVDQEVAVAAQQDMSLPTLGTVFAGHMVEAVVGLGGMGVVYRARHCKLDRLVALKVVVPALLEDASARRRFLEEASTAASLEHPNVVPVHEAGESNGIAYMVMRYVDGMDLRATVGKHGPLQPLRAAEIVASVGDALDAMHGAGYVHHDVTPGNVLIANSGHVYLSDFGLARQVSASADATRTGRLVGTVNYVAPEQIRGGRVDARADVYGLGGLLHFALTGRPPYERENDEAKLWAHLCDRPPSPSRMRPGIPQSIDPVVARALAKHPADRFPSAGELGRSALVAVRGTRVAASEPVGRPAPEAGDAGVDETATVSREAVAPADSDPQGPHRQLAGQACDWTRW